MCIIAQDLNQLNKEYTKDNSIGSNCHVHVYFTPNLDGGNAVFSPSRERVIISDRLLSENPKFSENELICRLEALLSAEIILIPSLKEDFTGHADGMVRFVDENTVIGNRSPYKSGLEQRIKTTLNRKGISVIDFPYYSSPGISAEGSYINYLETENDILLPVFGSNSDNEATEAAKRLFTKKIILKLMVLILWVALERYIYHLEIMLILDTLF